MPNVFLRSIPHFAPHWRSCYTWKTYILNTPIADLNLYIDAGTQILKPLDELFAKIDTQSYLAVSQGSEVSIRDITPSDYITRFNISESTLDQEVIAAGIFGFKKNSLIRDINEHLYEYGKEGLCVGFSKAELWKNKGVNKNAYIRDCKMFRHDTTLISILLRTHIPNITVEPLANFAGYNSHAPSQFMWSVRLNYTHLDYISPRHIHIHKMNKWVYINRILVKIFILTKVIYNKLK